MPSELLIPFSVATPQILVQKLRYKILSSNL
jgi:hypothetical protein